jgi:hypothetical protein
MMHPMGRTPDPAHTLGTAEHAKQLTEGRHPGVQTALAWLAFSHLPTPLQDLSRPFYQTAVELLFRVKTDSAELTTALNKLVEAKDWMVRAGIRHDQGQPGPVPRPADVVDAPRGVSVAGTLPNHPVFGQAQMPVRPDQQLIGRPIRDDPQA